MTQLSTTFTAADRTEEALTHYRDQLAPDSGTGRAITHVTVTLVLDTLTEATRLYEALTDGGDDSTPIAATPWGHWGCTTDRFGVQWMFNVPDPS